MDYFGEKGTKVCGICDNCLQNNDAPINSNIVSEWRRIILQKLQKKSPLLINELYHLFPSNKIKFVELILDEMLGEELVTRKFDQIFLKNPK